MSSTPSPRQSAQISVSSISTPSPCQSAQISASSTSTPSPRQSAQIPASSTSTPSPRQSAQISASSNSTPSRPASRHRRDNGYVFAATWFAGVLAAAASILFGIWAPLSYQTTKDGNRDNSDMSASMLMSVSVANSIARDALSTASAQASLLEQAQSRLGAMGQLALYQFCATQTAATPCQTFLASDPLISLVSYLASSKIKLVTTKLVTISLVGGSTPDAVTGPPPISGPSSGHSSLSSAAILSAFFGGMGVCGFVLGIFVWRHRKKRATQDERDESED